MLGSGDNMVSPIGVEDLALATVASLDLPRLRDRAIEVGGPHQISYRAALEEALAALGASSTEIRTIGRPLRGLGLGLLDRLQPRWFSRLRELELHASEDLGVAAGAFEDAFGWEPAPFERSLARALARPSQPENILEAYPLMQHRGPQATSYEPGTKPLAGLPTGP